MAKSKTESAERQVFFPIDNSNGVETRGMKVGNLTNPIGILVQSIHSKSGNISSVLVPGGKLKKKGDFYQLIAEDSPEKKAEKAEKRAAAKKSKSKKAKK